MCVCLDTSSFGKLHCLNSYTTTTEHVSSLSMAKPWVQLVQTIINAYLISKPECLIHQVIN